MSVSQLLTVLQLPGSRSETSSRAGAGGSGMANLWQRSVYLSGRLCHDVVLVRSAVGCHQSPVPTRLHKTMACTMLPG